MCCSLDVEHSLSILTVACVSLCEHISEHISDKRRIYHVLSYCHISQACISEYIWKSVLHIMYFQKPKQMSVVVK